MTFLYKYRKNNPNIYVEPQKPQEAKPILTKKNKARDITLPDFKLCYKTTV